MRLAFAHDILAFHGEPRVTVPLCAGRTCACIGSAGEIALVWLVVHGNTADVGVLFVASPAKELAHGT